MDMRNFQIAVALVALSAMCVAAAAPSDGETATSKSAKHLAAKPVKRDETAEKFRQLEEVVDQQQAALQQVQQQLQETQERLKRTEQRLSQTQETAQQADAKVATVETNTNLQVQKVQADLSDVKTALDTTTQTAQKAEKQVGELEHPGTIAYKHIRITPGGFLDVSGVYRTHATNSGPATPFNAVPLENGLAGVGGLSEFSATARGSRITLRADADAGTTKLAGYFESDFYGNTLATPNQTTAYGLRIRQAWGRAKFADGWSITGGQVWNLITMNRRAADADAAWVPNTIDTNYLVGYDWGRQAELRVAKTFGKGFTFALALTDPSYLNLGATNTNGQVAGLATAGAGNLGNSVVTSCTSGSTSTVSTTTPTTVTTTTTTLCPLTDTYSTNLAPDIIVKLAYDNPKLGHYEVKGIQRFFRDRIPGATAATSYNNTGLGGGVGAGAIIPVIANKVDFVAQGLYGKGISRYQDSGQYDFVVRTNTLSSTNTLTSKGGDNNLQDIKSFSAVLGFETRPTQRVEFDLYGGSEYYFRSTYDVVSTAAATLGKTLVEGYGAANGVNNRNVLLGTAVLWYNLYKGSYGTLRYGAQYEYAYRGTWSVGGAKAPNGIENIGQLGMRYILP
jgi:hypothetical protein